LASEHTRGSLTGGALEAAKAQDAQQKRTIALVPACSSSPLLLSSPSPAPSSLGVPAYPAADCHWKSR